MMTRMICRSSVPAVPVVGEQGVTDSLCSPNQSQCQQSVLYAEPRCEKELQGEMGRKGSFKPFLYMVLGGVVGLVVGALGHSLVLAVIGRLLSLWDSGVRTIGGLPIWESGLKAFLAWGVVIFGAVQGYWMAVEQSMAIGVVLVVIGVLMLTGVVVVLMRDDR